MTTEDFNGIATPQELTIPKLATADLPATGITGLIYYDITVNKLKVWTGAAYETVTSA